MMIYIYCRQSIHDIQLVHYIIFGNGTGFPRAVSDMISGYISQSNEYMKCARTYTVSDYYYG